MAHEQKRPYICGPLTELTTEEACSTKQLYEQLANTCEQTIGIRAFVPHEHCDPIEHANLEPRAVDAFERRQLCQHTSVLIVVTIAPSWGGGIEVEMANENQVPVVLLVPKGKRISRLLRGNPGIRAELDYSSADEAAHQLSAALNQLFPHCAPTKAP